MTQTRFKKVPFDIELAKKITNKEVKGRIVNGNGMEVRIICFDKTGNYPIVGLVMMKDGVEDLYTYSENGRENSFENSFDLHIEVPTYYKDYSNFEPCKRQICVVRDSEENEWGVLVCAGRNSVGEVVFYGENGNTYTWGHYLPLSKVTERLIGTSKSYKELVKELDAKLTATTKNKQQ